MLKTTAFVLTALCVAVPVTVLAERVSLDEVPEAVLDGFRKKHPEASDLEVDKESHFGLTLYEVKIKEASGHEHQSLLDVDGRPFGHEEPVDPDALPAAVRESVQRLFSSVAIKDAEAIHHPDGIQVEYEIDVRGDGADWEIITDAKGKVMVKERD